MMLVGHVMLGGRISGFVKDWFLVGPILLAFAGMDVKGGRFMKVATAFGATSMGIYLIHPLITRGLSVIITNLLQPPYSAQIVLVEWFLAWVLSLVVAYVLWLMPIMRRFM